MAHLSRIPHAGKYEGARKLMELVQHTESDAWLALSLATHLNLLPLSRQLSAITGYLWSRTLQAHPHTHLLKAKQTYPKFYHQERSHMLSGDNQR